MTSNKEYRAAYYQKNKEKSLQQSKQWKNSDKGKAYMKAYSESHREQIKETSTKWRIKNRQTILNEYGNKCARCGITDSRVLDLNHKNRDGAAERRKYKGTSLNNIVIKLGFPDTYNLLCRNCNWIDYLEHLADDVE